MKRIVSLCLLIACLLALAGCGIAFAEQIFQNTGEQPGASATKTADNSATPSNATESAKAQETPEPAKILLQYTIETIDESDDYTTKEASYPVTGVSTIDEDALELVHNAFADFDDIEEIFSDQKNYVGVDFDVERNDEIFAVVYQISSYYSGAAHGTTMNVAKVYTSPDGARVELGDLFANPDYVLRLSQLAEEKLRTLDIDVPQDKTYLDEDIWFYEGVAPDEVNFSQFVPTETGLQFIFSDYQVAPFAVGEVRLTIPWEDIEDIMKPEWIDKVSASDQVVL